MDVAKVYTITDEAVSGKWFELGEGARVKVARYGNERYMNVMKRLQRPYRNMRSVPDSVTEDIGNRAMAETIFLGFEGIEENGVPLEDNFDNRLKLLTGYKELRNHLSGISLDYKNFVEAEEEDAETGN